MSALSDRAGGLRGAVSPGGGLPRPRVSWLIPLAVAVVGLGLALACRAFHPHALPRVIEVGLGGLVLFAVCGDALSRVFTPAEWRPVRPLLSLAFGAVASGIVLMAFGVAYVPLHVSLWVTLALGIAASIWVRRRGWERTGVAADPLPRTWIWAAVALVLFLVALIPAWRTGALTIYGQNPDSSQVVGIAVLFQHVPPTHTDVSLPLDVVPQEWRFRYPIFYPLAAVSNLVHVDPIMAFPVLAALLLVVAALGYGLLAVRCFGAPTWAGPLIMAMLGFTWILTYLAWHPYWNQLWGTALMPYTLVFGWHALERRSASAGIACVLLLLMLWFAYPLALPYPLVLLAGVLVAFWKRPAPGWWRGRVTSWQGVVGVVILLALLLPAIAGSVLKLEEALSQLLTPHSALWGGDIKQFVSYGKFAGTGGGDVAAALVLIAGAYALWRLPGGRRIRTCFGIVLGALLLLDIRFRVTSSGTYMDFKHLSFMGMLVLSLAASGLLAAVARPGAGRWAAGLVLVVWCGAALVLDHRTAINQNEQVTPQLFQIRRWAAELPAGSSVRVDIPPRYGGMQLWAVYMLGGHPVDSYEPLIGTTYAHAIAGFRADYSLGLSTYPESDPAKAGQPFPQPQFTGRALLANSAFVVRPVQWPKRYDSVAQTASTRLVEP